MALSASAPPDVQNIVLRSLDMREPVIVSQPLDRPNIFISASKSVGMKRDFGRLAHILSTANDPSKTIIFSRTKDDVCKVFHFLSTSALYKNSIAMYHASQSEQTKPFIQTAFRSLVGELRCLSATIAFGMGMDIPDVEIVVINGCPATLAQMYQMFGRAGRNGCSALAHLYFTNSQIKQNQGPSLVCFAENQENCRRKRILTPLGSREVVATNEACCDICTGHHSPCSRLNLLVPVPQKRSRKRKPVRHISANMAVIIRDALEKERKKLLEEYAGYKMMGSSFLISDSAITNMCHIASTINSIEDLSSIGSLRPEFRSRIFNVLWDIVSSASSPEKRQKRS